MEQSMYIYLSVSWLFCGNAVCQGCCVFVGELGGGGRSQFSHSCANLRRMCKQDPISRKPSDFGLLVRNVSQTDRQSGWEVVNGD